MRVTPLEVGLATAAVVVIFGPKGRFSRKARHSNSADLRSLAPSQPAAGRAPSPLQQQQQPAEERRYSMDGVGLAPPARDDSWGSAR